jgi:hypothetical protein
VGSIRPRMSVGAVLALRSVLVFNALLLIVVAGLLARFMEHPAGLIGAAVCLLGAGMAIGGARWTDRLYDLSR